MDYAKPQWWLVREQGERDGVNSSPDPALLRSEYREDYIMGYWEGFNDRKCSEAPDRFNDLWSQMFQGRYPGAPPHAIIA